MAWEENGVVIADPEQVVLESDPPRRLSYTWHTFTPQCGERRIRRRLLARVAGEPRSKVTFDLEPDGDQVRLTVVHNDFVPGSTVLEMVSAGWPRLLSRPQDPAGGGRGVNLSHAQGLFGPFGGRVWLNTAHQGPMPRPAADAARAAIEDKLDPHRIGDEVFLAVPERLRALLARLMGARSEEVVWRTAPATGFPSSPRARISAGR